MAARFVRDEEAAGSNPATPTMKLQVAALFRDEFGLPVLARLPVWERAGVCLVLCDPGRCLTPEFRFPGDSLRTRFR